MIDYAALLERINQSGIKRIALAEKLGCTMPTLRAKLSGKSEMTVGEAYTLAKVLGFTSKEIRSIFFAPNVEKMST